VHIPYKGAGVAIIDLLSGQVSLMFSSVGPAAPHVNVGKIKALAVTGESQLPVLPGVPTLAEAGYAAATVVGYWGVLAPAGIPRDVLDKLSATIAAVVKRPEVRQRLMEQGVDPTGSGPAEYDRIIRSEIAKWAKVIKQAGIKVE
jgi:tripartite-type tricarboxylate transporter receptor subunit TctC